METLAIAISLIILIAAAILFWKSRQPASKIDINQTLADLRQEIGGLRVQMNDGLGNMGAIATGMLGTQAATSQRLTELEKAAQSMIEVGRDISSLQNILQPPKLRGTLGETLLENMLSLYLPCESFAMQYQFSNGAVVDAVILLSAGIVPVDAKFPLDNFRRMLESTEDKDKQQYRRDFARDVRKHIDDISKKYILPDEGTLDFALSYIPAENVYYEITVKDETGGSIADYALPWRVILVSPNTFYAYLQAIAMGLKGLRIERFAREILGNLSRLKGDFDGLQADFRVLGTHIHNASQKYGDADKKLTRFGDKLSSLETPVTDTELIREVEPSYLQAPGSERDAEGERNES